MPLDLAWIAEATGARRATVMHQIQALWSGYGELVRVALVGTEASTAVVKWVRPPVGVHNVSHQRKCRSYEVEMRWYADFAARCDATCHVPKLLAQRVGPSRDERILVFEDLDAFGFDRRTHRPSASQLRSCLAWLASFHARFLGVAPTGLWSTGTYWHLATRREELPAIEWEPLRQAAPILDRKLHECTFRTLVHGDAKPANFCFSRGDAVAAVDFQYVGGGCGMKDVAYLLDGEDEAAEAHLLEHYVRALRLALASRPDVDAEALEVEWRRLYPIASADYLRFLAGWAPDSFRRDSRAQVRVRRVLAQLQ